MTEHRHEWRRKEYEYDVYDFHCIKCNKWMPPEEIERRLNACEALSTKDVMAQLEHTPNHILDGFMIEALREYAKLRGEQ